MSIAFYLPIENGMALGFSSEAGVLPRLHEILPASEEHGEIFISYGVAGIDAGCNTQGTVIVGVPARSRYKADSRKQPAPDYLREALKVDGGALEVRDRLMALADEWGTHPSGNRSSHSRAGSFLVAGEGANGPELYLVEIAGQRWAWRAVEEPLALAGAFTITDNYKRLDAATRKSIAPVNAQMACLDESDPGRVADKESWKFYVEPKTIFKKRRKKTEARQEALEAYLKNLGPNPDLEAVFGLLSSHSLGDGSTGDGSTGQPFAICEHKNFPDAAASTAFLFVKESGKSKCDIWITGQGNTCKSVFKPVVLGESFVNLWTEYPLGADPDGKRMALWRKSLGKSKAAPAQEAGNSKRSIQQSIHSLLKKYKNSQLKEDEAIRHLKEILGGD